MRVLVQCLLLLLLPITLRPAMAEQLVVAADVWCPFNCQPDAPLPGYTVELMREVFAQDTVEYRVVPWKRAILQTRNGTSTAAIAMSKETAEKERLQIGREPIGFSNDCLYVPVGSSVTYANSADDLNVLQRVGIVVGYEYDDGLGEWLARPANKPKIFTESGEEPAVRNLRKLVSGRLDAMIEDRSVVEYLLLDPAFAGRVVSAGCNQGIPLYMGFGPKGSRGDALVVQFDQGMANLRRSGRVAQIMAKYGLKDWQQ